ncbi:MAG TPA: hypothetical protein VKA85_05275 [Candidatus Limnocylindrales bacterium]|nr:hypothetical protein [Candidatus Limnocylindrales bacterium]
MADHPAATAIRRRLPLEVKQVSTEEQHVALPKLYGAPAYARPPVQTEAKPRPFDPDEMPITAFQTEDERELLDSLPPRAFAPGGIVVERGRGAARQTSSLLGRPFGLRALAGRLLGGS